MQTGLKHLKISESLFNLETHVAITQKVGPMKPLQGPTRSGNPEKHTPLPSSDAEERVEEEFRAAAFNRSAEDISNTYSNLILNTNEGSH
jgi:hypothetical protein